MHGAESTSRDIPATAAHALAQQFAQRAVAWARARGAPDDSVEALRLAACKVSHATTEGHVCIALEQIEREEGRGDAAWRERLLASRVVGTPAAPDDLPLILDDGGRLYLHRYFDYERRLAHCLRTRAAAPLGPLPVGLRAQLDRLFAGNAASLEDRVDWQRVGVALAMLRPLTIVSGGPGTGKTTAVVSLLACLLAQDPGCRIRLAAPTGKAAARMLDAIRLRTSALEPSVATRFPTESFTIHRLLGASGTPGSFRHNAANPLPIDMLVVDEASMLDLALATRLFEAVPQAAKIVLLGDKDQLAAVEAGAVFAEICADPTLGEAARGRLAAATGIAVERIVAPPPLAPGLQDCVVWFTENFRFDAGSGIGRLAGLINAGKADEAIEWLRAGTDPSVRWIDDTGRTPGNATTNAAQAGYEPYLHAVRSGAETKAIFDAFNRFRVLCAERDGARGVAGMNDLLSRWFRAALDHPLDPGARSAWYPGRPVMVLRNDYVLRLYNGDVGIALPDGQGRLSVVFRDADDTLRQVAPTRLPEHETAFATTVHKAQGSEFDELLLMLPARASRVTRELVYTGVTRARVRATVAAPAEVLGEATARRATGGSGLQRRLHDAPSSTRS